MSAQNSQQSPSDTFNSIETPLIRLSDITDIEWTEGKDGRFYSDQHNTLFEASYEAGNLNKRFSHNRYNHIFLTHKSSMFGGVFGTSNPHQIVISPEEALNVIEIQNCRDEILANRQKAKDMLEALDVYTQILSWEQRWGYNDEPMYDYGKIPFGTADMWEDDAKRISEELNSLFGVSYFRASSGPSSLQGIRINEEDIVKLDIDKLTSATNKLIPPAPVYI